MMQRFDINFVAHADDDTLFMQPDIHDSYVAGRGQVGVAVTAAIRVSPNFRSTKSKPSLVMAITRKGDLPR